MENYQLVKHATSLAKSKKYDYAIQLLSELYKSNEVSDAEIIKVIPYYQKAGRYNELEQYFEEILIPLIRNINERNFSHKCKEIQYAFISVSIHKIYNKLELCAKRENKEDDKSKFSSKAILYYQLYRDNLVKGKKIELELGYTEARSIWGGDHSKWP